MESIIDSSTCLYIMAQEIAIVIKFIFNHILIMMFKLGRLTSKPNKHCRGATPDIGTRTGTSKEEKSWTVTVQQLGTSVYKYQIAIQ